MGKLKNLQMFWWVIPLLFSGAGIYFVLVYRGDTVYPHVPSKYPYEEHLAFAREIERQVPNGYVDSRQYVEYRTYWYISGLLKFYKQMGEEKDIDNAVRLLKVIEARCNADTDNDGFKDCRGYYVYDSNLLTQGYISDMFARGIHTIKKENVERYYADAARWEELVDEHFLPYYDNLFRAYEVNGEKMGYFLSSANDGSADQFNRDAGVAMTYMWRWKDTGKAEYKDKPERLLNRYFDEVVNPRKTYNGLVYLSPLYSLYDARSGEQPKNCYSNPNAYLCKGITDTSHLNAEFELIATGYENGLVSRQELGLVTNTIKVMLLENGKVGDRATPILNQQANPPRKMYLDEKNIRNIYHQTGMMHNFIRFGVADNDLVYDMEEILRTVELSGKLNGNYYTDIYRCVKDPQNNYVEFCQDITNFGGRVENFQIFYAIANLGEFQ